VTTNCPRWCACLLTILCVTTLSGCFGTARFPALARKNSSETCVQPLKKTAARSPQKSTHPSAIVDANLPREIDRFH